MSLTVLKMLYPSKVIINQQQQRRENSYPSNSAGFTLIELIAVVIIIGVLSAIAAPGWLTFVNRQRVSKVNDAVFSALQEAQREAKSKKLSYSASFRKDSTGIFQVAIHRTKDDSDIDIVLTANDTRWKPLSQGLEIKAGQILLCSKISTTDCNWTSPKKITFDYQGNLSSEIDPDAGITVAIPQGDNPTQPIASTKRCVVVKTIIGTMKIDSENNCPSS